MRRGFTGGRSLSELSSESGEGGRRAGGFLWEGLAAEDPGEGCGGFAATGSVGLRDTGGKSASERSLESSGAAGARGGIGFVRGWGLSREWALGSARGLGLGREAAGSRGEGWIFLELVFGNN